MRRKERFRHALQKESYHAKMYKRKKFWVVAGSVLAALTVGTGLVGQTFSVHAEEPLATQQVETKLDTSVARISSEKDTQSESSETMEAINSSAQGVGDSVKVDSIETNSQDLLQVSQNVQAEISFVDVTSPQVKLPSITIEGVENAAPTKSKISIPLGYEIESVPEGVTENSEGTYSYSGTLKADTSDDLLINLVHKTGTIVPGDENATRLNLSVASFGGVGTFTYNALNQVENKLHESFTMSTTSEYNIIYDFVTGKALKLAGITNDMVTPEITPFDLSYPNYDFVSLTVDENDSELLDTDIENGFSTSLESRPEIVGDKSISYLIRAGVKALPLTSITYGDMGGKILGYLNGLNTLPDSVQLVENKLVRTLNIVISDRYKGVDVTNNVVYKTVDGKVVTGNKDTTKSITASFGDNISWDTLTLPEGYHVIGTPTGTYTADTVVEVTVAPTEHEYTLSPVMEGTTILVPKYAASTLTGQTDEIIPETSIPEIPGYTLVTPSDGFKVPSIDNINVEYASNTDTSAIISFIDTTDQSRVIPSFTITGTTDSPTKSITLPIPAGYRITSSSINIKKNDDGTYSYQGIIKADDSDNIEVSLAHNTIIYSYKKPGTIFGTKIEDLLVRLTRKITYSGVNLPEVSQASTYVRPAIYDEVSKEVEYSYWRVADIEDPFGLSPFADVKVPYVKGYTADYREVASPGFDSGFAGILSLPKEKQEVVVKYTPDTQFVNVNYVDVTKEEGTYGYVIKTDRIKGKTNEEVDYQSNFYPIYTLVPGGDVTHISFGTEDSTVTVRLTHTRFVEEKFTTTTTLMYSGLRGVQDIPDDIKINANWTPIIDKVDGTFTEYVPDSTAQVLVDIPQIAGYKSTYRYNPFDTANPIVMDLVKFPLAYFTTHKRPENNSAFIDYVALPASVTINYVGMPAGMKIESKKFVAFTMQGYCQDSPTIPDYTVDKAIVRGAMLPGDTIITVTYKPVVANAIVDFIDTEDGSNILKASKIVGDANFKPVKNVIKIPDGYEPVDNSLPQNVEKSGYSYIYTGILKTDKSDDIVIPLKQKKTTYEYTDTDVPSGLLYDLTREFTRNVLFENLSGTQIAEPMTQIIMVARKGYYNEVSKNATFGKWEEAEPLNLADSKNILITSPTIENFGTPSIKVVPKMTPELAIQAEERDSRWNHPYADFIVYYRSLLVNTMVYVKDVDDNNKVIDQVEIGHGHFGDIIDDGQRVYIPEGYELTDGSAVHSVAFPAIAMTADNSDDKVISVRHKISTNPEPLTRTINYFYNSVNGKKAAESVVQTIMAKTVTDLVTDNKVTTDSTIWKNWIAEQEKVMNADLKADSSNPEKIVLLTQLDKNLDGYVTWLEILQNDPALQKVFYKVTSINIPGYMASIEVVPEQKVDGQHQIDRVTADGTSIDGGIVINVIYTENKASAAIHFVDDDEKGAPVQTVTIGGRDQEVADKLLEIPNGYELATVQPDAKISVDADGKAHYVGTFVAKDNSDSATLHLVHARSITKQTQNFNIDVVAGKNVDETKLPIDSHQSVQWTLDYDMVTRKTTLTPDANSIADTSFINIAAGGGVTYVPTQKIVAGQNFETISNVDKFDIDDVNVVVTYHAAKIGDGIATKVEVPSDEVPSAKIYPVNYITEDKEVVATSEFIGNAGDYVYATVPENYRLIDGQADKHLISEADTSVTFVVEKKEKAEVPTTDAPTAKIYTVVYKTVDGTILKTDEFTGNAGDYVHAEIPEDYRLVDGQTANYLISEADISVTFVVEKAKTSGVPTTDAPTAKIYPVAYKTVDGTVVKTREFTGNAGDYVHAEVPENYRLVDGQTANYLISEADTSVTFIVEKAKTSGVPTTEAPTAKIYPVVYKTVDGTVVKTSEFTGNAGDYVHAEVPSGYVLEVGQVDSYLLNEKDTSVTFVVVSMDEVPGDKTPTDEVPGDETPTYEVPGDKTPTDEVPGDKTPTDEVPGDETPTDEVPGDETPTDEVPSDKTPIDEATDDKTPSENSLNRETKVPLSNVSTTVNSGAKVPVTGSNVSGTKDAGQETLPQTGDRNSSALSAIGLAFIGVFGMMFGKKRKRN